jgi:hypothetical protein
MLNYGLRTKLCIVNFSRIYSKSEIPFSTRLVWPTLDKSDQGLHRTSQFPLLDKSGAPSIKPLDRPLIAHLDSILFPTPPTCTRG